MASDATVRYLLNSGADTTTHLYEQQVKLLPQAQPVPADNCAPDNAIKH